MTPYRRPVRGRHIRRIACALLCVMAAAGFSGQVHAADQDADLTQVRVQLKWRHQFQFAGYYAAIEKGYYRDVGLDVTLVEHAPGVTPIDQLMLGRAQFAVADTGALIYRSTGVPIVSLAAIYQHSPSVLMTRGDRGIETLEDLRYRRLMLGGGYMNAELMAMMRRAGLNLEEMNLVPSETSVQALIEGRVDAYNAYTANEPYFMGLKGIPFLLFKPRDYGVDFYGDILLTTEAMIAEAPDVVDAFRTATLKGWEYAVEHQAEIVDLILAKYNTQNKNRAHLMFEASELSKLVLSNVVPVGYMHEERWRKIERVFTDQGRLARPVDLAAFIYPSGEVGHLVGLWKRHRGRIIAGAAAVLALLLVSHILSLRVQIRARTRELEDAKREAELEARTDELTGLPNRRQFFEGFARDLSRADRQNLSISLIVADIDHFKQINDTYGHAAGDEALRCVSSVLKAHVRSGDLAARIGGEEFALGCFGSPLEETRHLAERLRHEVEGMEIERGGKTFGITLSFGIAERTDGQSADRVFDAADKALYEAKRAGRNTISVFEER